MTKNHFTTLGLKPGASEDDIKKAYKGLARKFHPDKNKETDAEEKFKEIAAAYDYLKNQDRRELLERDLNRPKFTETKATNGFSKFTKSDFKTSNGFESDWSKKFGANSENRYNGSAFNSYADEGKDPFSSYNNMYSNGKGKKSSTKQKPKKKEQTPHSRPRRPWSHEWTSADDTDFFDIPTPEPPPRPQFSFAFKSFVDDLGMSFETFFNGKPMNSGMFEFNTFFDTSDPFEDFFKQNHFGMPQSGRTPRRPRKRNVAPERGAADIDPDFMFTSPRPPGDREKENSFAYMDTHYGLGRKKSNLDDDDMDSRLFKCTYCEKRMPFSQLSSHEPGCALRRGGRFDVESDEDRSPNGANLSDDDLYTDTASFDGDQYPHNTGDWRQTHEELLRNIRKAKRAANKNNTPRRYNSATTSSTAKENKDEGIAQVRCKWCGRNFSHPAAKHHIPFCEKWTKEHGTPLNPAGKSPSRDTGSKNQKAKEYAKNNIPRPRGRSSEEFDSDSPRSQPSHYDNFPNIHKRETMNRPGASSSTGLHSAYNPRAERSSPVPGTSGTSRTQFTPRSKPQMGSSARTTRPTSHEDSNTSFENKERDFEDSYGFGLSGTRLKTEPRSRQADVCPKCKKKNSGLGRFSCTCGSKRTGS